MVTLFKVDIYHLLLCFLISCDSKIQLACYPTCLILFVHLWHMYVCTYNCFYCFTKIIKTIVFIWKNVLFTSYIISIVKAVTNAHNSHKSCKVIFLSHSSIRCVTTVGCDTGNAFSLTRFVIQAKCPDGKWTRKPLAY